MNKSILALALSLAVAGTAYAGGGTMITPVNLDAPDQGLNDPTPAIPVGNNPGTTVGEQRRVAYRFAADTWAQVLVSNVEILVEASFAPKTCTATSGVLGSAGTKTVHANFTNSVPELWYGAALANSRAGSDLSPTNNDISSSFNSNLGTPGCLENSGWYYGLDGATPAGKINFLNVVMHEIGHGLNFQGFYNGATGAPFSGRGDIYSSFVRDNNSGMAWSAMTDAQRATAAIGNNLVWTGSEVTNQAPSVLGAQVNLFILGRRPSDFPMVTAGYGPVATTANFNGTVVLGKDASGSTQGCSAYAAGKFTGKTVLIDRGTCSFKTKTLNAQNAGAAKVIVANNAVSGFPGMGDDAAITTPITIPSIGITLSDGNTIKKSILLGVQAGLQVKPGQFAGTDTTGRVYLFSPNPFASGSTFSHFDVRLSPNALMEPFISADLNANSPSGLDLTPALFKDVGWTLQLP